MYLLVTGLQSVIFAAVAAGLIFGLAGLMRPFQAPLARRDGAVEISGVKRILESQPGRDAS